MFRHPRRLFLALVFACASAAAAEAQLVIGDFPTIQVPDENPLTPEKIRLGQALFYEEQLSSDDTMACATCHLPDTGGGDPRAGQRGPGADGILFTPDDEFGSPAMRLQDAGGNYQAHALFGFGRQSTARNSPSVLGAVFFNTQFWDSRALPTFRDLNGQVVIQQYGSLESQAVEPVISQVEMGEAQRTWPELIAKLERVRPLDLAREVPQRLENFLDGATSYGPLFRKAFGTDQITRERIAMAIASYERTLVPDHSPFDLGTMTPRQQLGFQVYQTRGFCELCHPSDGRFFSDGALRNLGLPDHARDVKTPSLRNAGLRKRYMSSGQFATLDEVITFYEHEGFIAFQNQIERIALIDFLENALTDPRAARREPPFERPLLRSEVEPTGARLYGTATTGSGAFRPEMLADTPPNLGSESFRIGLGAGRGGAQALLLTGLQAAPPGTSYHGIPIYVDAGSTGPRSFLLSGSSAGEGGATFHANLPAEPALVGRKFYAQWLVLDPAATAGVAVSEGAEFELFSRSYRPKLRR